MGSLLGQVRPGPGATWRLRECLPSAETGSTLLRRPSWEGLQPGTTNDAPLCKATESEGPPLASPRVSPRPAGPHPHPQDFPLSLPPLLLWQLSCPLLANFSLPLCPCLSLPWPAWEDHATHGHCGHQDSPFTVLHCQTAPGGPSAILSPLASQDSTGNPLPLRAGPNLRQLCEFTAFYLKTDSTQPPRKSVLFRRVI